MKLRSTQWAVAALIAGMATAATAQEVRRAYIVQLADPAAASYAGGLAGLQATKPVAGSRLDVGAADVQAYLNYLDGKQSRVLSTLPNAKLLYQYGVVFNGFSALLSDAEASKLQANSAVVSIVRDERRQLDTNYTPGFMGLSKPGGLWDQLGGPTGSLSQSGAGENIIIGVIDGGVWPENTSFADRVGADGKPTLDPNGTLVYGAPPAHWKGLCEAGEGFGPAHCNNKLIGARAFTAAITDPETGGLSVNYKKHPAEFISPRDNGGHGTHTASTAGGNANVTSYLDGGTAPMHGVSGIAPRARIATYKVCWTSENPATTRPDPRWPAYDNGCSGFDSIAAIERAVQDGVHVLNYSISGSATNIADPVDVAFKGAVDAGVFVAASAGNSGPANAVNHLGPWMTTVGNSTHDRFFQGTVALGSGVNIKGASSNPTTPSATLILAKDAGLPDAPAENLRMCFGGADGQAPLLDPAKVAGKLLVCDRGGNVLVNKSANAKTAGAVGMVIANTNVPASANTILNAPHSLSTVHVLANDGDAIKKYVADNPGVASASLGNLEVTKSADLAPKMNNSSSRGPNQGNLNILKPDLTAPGTDILAAYTPAYTIADHDAIIAGTAAGVPNWSLLTGTSMSSPHVAGLAALLRHKYPDWSPAAIRSALMTTGIDVYPSLSGMQSGQLPWGQGAGFVQPSVAADPGLVYDITTNDYNRFMCGVGYQLAGVKCANIGTVASYNLNLPSLTASVVGSLTLTRTVKNVGSGIATYQASGSAPSGFAMTVTPSTLTLAAGESKSYAVKLTRTDAALDAWNYGSLSWSDGVHQVRSPVTVRALAAVVPAQINGKNTSGNKLFTIGTGFAGAMSSTSLGLKAAERTNGSLTVDETGDATAACKSGGNDSVKAINVVVPTGTAQARFALFDEETSGFKQGKIDDLDMMVLDAAGKQVGSSGGSSSNELVVLNNPAAGTYRACVVRYSSTLSSVSFTLNAWTLGSSGNTGTFRVGLPSDAVIAGTASAAVSWSGLATGNRYLGIVQYLVGGKAVGSTLVNVDTRVAPLPETADLVSDKAPQAKQL